MSTELHCLAPHHSHNSYCNAGSLNLPFWDVQRNERNGNNNWDDTGFIAATLHLSYEVLYMQYLLWEILLGGESWEPCKAESTVTGSYCYRTNVLLDELLWNWFPTLLFRLMWIKNLFVEYMLSYSYLRISIQRAGLWSKPGLNLLLVLAIWPSLFIASLMS